LIEKGIFNSLFLDCLINFEPHQLITRPISRRLVKSARCQCRIKPNVNDENWRNQMKALTAIGITLFISCLSVGTSNAAKENFERTKPPAKKAIDHNASRSNTTSRSPTDNDSDKTKVRDYNSSRSNRTGVNQNKPGDKVTRKKPGKNNNCNSNKKDCPK
jgi:hypothetical protein